MALRARLDARVRTLPRQEVAAVRVATVLPCKEVEDYLTRDRVVRGLCLSPRAVHAALLEEHARAVPEDADPPARTTCGVCADWTLDLPAPAHAAACHGCGRCPHCLAGHALVDARAGHAACSACGAVLAQLRVHAEPYKKDVDEGGDAAERAMRGRPSSVSGVPDWLVRRNAARVEGGDARRALREFEHWNHYVGLPQEALRDLAARYARDGGGQERLAAMLLYPVLRAHLRIKEDVTFDLTTGNPLLFAAVGHDPGDLRERPPPHPVEKTQPDPTFRCPSCSELLYKARDARFHCRSGFGVKRRRI